MKPKSRTQTAIMGASTAIEGASALWAAKAGDTSAALVIGFLTGVLLTVTVVVAVWSDRQPGYNRAR